VRRRLRIALLWIGLGSLLLCAACVAQGALGPELTLLQTAGPHAVDARVHESQLCVSWAPKPPYRPAWAGQINRHGVRYTRWSDASAEVRIPLLYPAAGFALLTLITLLPALMLRPRPPTETPGFRVVTND
jgi:hypothetical protein